MNNQLIVNNKQKLKKKVIFDLVISTVAVVLAFLFFFLPIFSINSTSGTRNISIFDEVRRAINILINGGSATALLSAIFPAFILIFSIILLVLASIDIYKNVKLFLNFDNSVLKFYDNIVSDKEKKIYKTFQTQNSVYELLTFLLFHIIYSKFLYGNYTLMRAVNGVCVPALIFFILVIGVYLTFAILSNNIAKIIKKQHLEKKYEQEQATIALTQQLLAEQVANNVEVKDVQTVEETSVTTENINEEK